MAVERRIFAWVSQLWASETLDATEYFARLEREFGVTIGPDETPALCTLGDLSALVSRKLAAAGRPLPEDAVWRAVRWITSQELGVREGDLRPDTRFVEDLCF
jgi:hypothetical protein